MTLFFVALALIATGLVAGMGFVDYTLGRTLDFGAIQVLIDSMSAIGTGVATSQVFAAAKPATLGDAQAVLEYQMIANGTMTAFTADLEHSLDGGTTWTKRVTIDFNANPVGTAALSQAGLYRLNVKSFTLNTATTAKVLGGC